MSTHSRSKQYSATSEAAHQRLVSTGRAQTLQDAVSLYIHDHSPCTRPTIASGLADLTKGKESAVCSAVAQLIEAGRIRRGPKVINSATNALVETLVWAGTSPAFTAPTRPADPKPSSSWASKVSQILDLVREAQDLGAPVDVGTAGRVLSITVTFAGGK